ncbi:patched domain-containing protein 3-like [Centruroides sculpturatus]|uniref:patched domain-containing protein 3-like n=1 Tax=Centruroides sculpturatus TaxID=218467 RepID=UPI000C6E06D2|nr:patched domain-containing protein 3-like [Centruroides sculpturatus]XP_023235818.1 patched domain-containing protein 3-like [Centruroides sculpturatus]
MKLDCIRKIHCYFFKKLGRTVGRYPYYFILLPVILSTTLTIFVKELPSIKTEITPDSGKRFSIKQFVENTFSYNSSQLSDQIRVPDVPNCLLIHLMKKDKGNMFEKNVLSEVKLVDEIIQNITLKTHGKLIQYRDICTLMHKKCFENPIIEVISEVGIDSIIQKRKKIKYPLDIDFLSFTYKAYFMNLGGVTEDNHNFVDRVNAITIIYLTDDKNEIKKNLFDKWSNHVYDTIQQYHFTYINVVPNSPLATKKGFQTEFQKTKPKIGGLVAFMIALSTFLNMSNKWVRSKPLLGLASVINAGLAVVSSFGLMAASGVESTYWNVTIPFLVLVTEIDDAFVLIGCWRISNPKYSVERRMEETYSEAGVSITLTSLTNFFSYCIGMMAPFPFIRIFSYYTATCIMFNFVYQITFFGGCLALSGYREKGNLRSGKFVRCEQNDDYLEKNKNTEEEFTMAIFRDLLGKTLSNTSVKLIIIIIYTINLSFGIWGTFHIEHGIKYESLFPKDSLITRGFRINYNYFTRYSYPFQIIINETLDYSDIKVQMSIETVLTKFENHPNIAGKEFTVSWLKFYKEFQKSPVAKFSLQGYNMSNKQDFIDGLRDVFFNIRAAQSLSNDVVFNSNNTDILYSRFFIMGKNLNSSHSERETLKDLLKIADESDIPVLVHCVKSGMIEQGIIIGQMIKQLFWITAVLITVIFLLFVPNLLIAIIVAISVVSAMIETLGYMSLWGVNLDIISMISLILCVGFSVNYPTHVSYAYVMSASKTPNEKLKDSLYRIGFPILQGSLTTGLGILILYSDVYFLCIFAKIVILIAMETAFHALFFIPVVLSVIYAIFEKINFLVE